MERKTYRVSTLGCRVNRADSLAIEKELSARGFTPAEDREVPHLWVINTCAVTGEGMRKSRKLVRRCALSGASVVVTGCGVEMDAGGFQVDGVDAIVGNEMKPNVFCDADDRAVYGGDSSGADEWAPRDLVRVPVKVQDGCERFCSYCVVPYLRPNPYSRPAREVLREVRTLAALDAGEVILCGIDLGSYRDPETGGRIDSLLEAVTAQAGDLWVRLSSIELSDVSDRLLELLRAGGGIRRHLHVPMQSGDAGVLADMGRNYTPEGFAGRINRIRDYVEDVALTTDVMVGFPTEDERAFQSTKELVGALRFSRVHVFKYSRRPGTEAYDLGDPVDGNTKNRRAAELRELAALNARRFHRGFLGRIIPVLVEAVLDGAHTGNGQLFCRTEGFAGIVIKGGADLAGKVVEVQVTSAGPQGMRGRMTGELVTELRVR